jgi:hypothetical protein
VRRGWEARLSRVNEESSSSSDDLVLFQLVATVKRESQREAYTSKNSDGTSVRSKKAPLFTLFGPSGTLRSIERASRGLSAVCWSDGLGAGKRERDAKVKRKGKNTDSRAVSSLLHHGITVRPLELLRVRCEQALGSEARRKEGGTHQLRLFDGKDAAVSSQRVPPSTSA